MNRTRFPWLAGLVAAGALVSSALAQQNFEPAKAVTIDAAVLRQIEARTAELRTAIGALPEKTPADVRADVEVYLKAADWVVRHGEFFQKDSPRQTLAVIDAGLARARAAREGKTPWREVRGKPVIRGYCSGVDGSVQPYSVTIPEGFKPGDKKWRLDIVLHGRDQTLTEVKFIAGKENAKAAGKGADFVVLEPYGRGNNAYRWAGEADVFEAEGSYLAGNDEVAGRPRVRPSEVVLRGFSMGGAGAWHLGLHHPFRFSAIGPGAGFTTTRGYIKGLPELPDYQEKCLRIYDAVDYAENAFHVPVVAYSGANDPQKAAADNIEQALKGFQLPVRFTHLVAPGLAHAMPAGWQAKAEAAYREQLREGRPSSDRVRFVTYTARYNNDFSWLLVEGLDRHYDRAVVDAHRTKDRLTVTTTNARVLRYFPDDDTFPAEAAIDGQTIKLGKDLSKGADASRLIVKRDGQWRAVDYATRPDPAAHPEKRTGLQGPIDDAFGEGFVVVGPTGTAWSEVAGRYAPAALTRFAGEWEVYFRGKLPLHRPADGRRAHQFFQHLVLFGDPASNPLIAQVVGKLPITWTRDKLVVNGVGYDPKTHVPALIYPSPLNPSRYVVINSGHTFHAAELNGTNAQLYPRLGDWAVLKPTPTAKDPAAAEVVAAGLFDEFWQFPKK